MEISIFIISIAFFFYMSLGFIFRRWAKSYITEEANKLRDIRSEECPEVSLLIPTYNEEKTITKKIQNVVELDYPSNKLEIIFIDDCSQDSTPKLIAQKVGKSNNKIKLIRKEKRMGYNSAIIEGLRHASNKIIVLTDAGAYLDTETVKNLVKRFNEPLIGVIMGKQKLLNVGEGVTPKLEVAYWKFYELSRMAESHIDSISVSKGECMALRREICENILCESERFINIGSVDVSIVYEARRKGYKAKIEPNATFFEYAPGTLVERFQQKTRRAVKQIESMLIFKYMLLNREFGKFGLVILPIQFITLLFLPWMFVLGLSTLILGSALSLDAALYVWIFLISILTLAAVIDRYTIVSFSQSQISLIIATLRILFGRKSALMDIIPSTRK